MLLFYGIVGTRCCCTSEPNTPREQELHAFLDFLGNICSLLGVASEHRSTVFLEPAAVPLLHALELLRHLRSSPIDGKSSSGIVTILEHLAEENEAFIDLAILLLDSDRVPPRHANQNVIDNLTATVSDFPAYLGNVHAWLVHAVDDDTSRDSPFPEPPDKQTAIKALEVIRRLQAKKQFGFSRANRPKIARILEQLVDQDKTFLDLALKLVDSPFDHHCYLADDLQDFIGEKDAEGSKHHFWGGFWKTCASMIESGVDLSDKQLAIIKPEYDKVKRARQLAYINSILGA